MSIEREVLETPKRSVGFHYTFGDGTEVDSKDLAAASGGHPRAPVPGQPGMWIWDDDVDNVFIYVKNI